MTGRILRLSPMLAVLALAACGSSVQTITVITTVTATTKPPPKPATSYRVYFLRDGKVAPVARTGSPSNALEDLQLGPSPQERGLGLTTAVPRRCAAKVCLEKLSRAAQAQIVYTLSQDNPSKPAPEVGRFRADFEDFTPAILVESPLPFEAVSAPLRVTGTANTFEATFQYELTDPAGKVLASHFVTATSGSGTRGTFDFTIPFEAPDGLGKLIVYETSAENGQRIHQVEIPLSLRR